jgi:hypothetical protein
MRFDVYKCRDYLRQHRETPGEEISICGMCVYSCPHGQKHPSAFGAAPVYRGR